MAERVVVRQDIDFETEFLAKDPSEEDGELQVVEDIRDIDPYSMLLASLGACTAILVNTYARHHGIPLEETEIRLEYERVFKEDCEHCEELSAGQYDEQIKMEAGFRGNLTGEQREKLFKISLQCPVHKMFESGIRISAKPLKEALEKK